MPSFLQQNVHKSIDSITIKNCQNVTIGSRSIENLKSLRYLDISNVDHLYLSAYSLEWKGYETAINNHDYQRRVPSLSISISKTRIESLDQYAIKGQPVELKFNQVHFDKIQSFAFSSLSKLSLIDIKNCTFKQISSQAFKKIETDRFTIIDSHFTDTLPSRSFTDIDVLEQFKIINSDFQVVDSTAFIVNLPTSVEISNSRFGTLHSESFKIRTRGAVTIKNNVFQNLNENAFIGLSYIKEHRAMINQDAIFDYNTINELSSKPSLSWNRTSFNPKYGLIIVNKTCDCLSVDIWINNNEWKEHIHCVVDSRKFTTKKALDFKASSCDKNSSTWIILVSVFSVLLLVLIIVAVVIVLLYQRYKRNKLKEYVNRGRNKTGSVGMVVPDGRTYRETEVHVIVEKAELLTTEL